jgi:hypothetical protein
MVKPMQKTPPIALVVGLFAAVLVVTAPVATAQNVPPPNVSYENFVPPGSDDQIKPETGSVQIKFKIKYSMQSPAQSGVVAVASTAVVKVTPSCDDPDVTVLGPGSVLISIAAGQTTSLSSDLIYTATATRNAPGLQLINCRFKIKADQLQGTAVPPSAEVDQAFQVTVDYFPYIQAKLTAATLDAGPQKPIPFSITVSNFGNAQTQVIFELATEIPEKWQNIIMPPALTLDSPNGQGSKTEDTATFTVNTPYRNGWNNDEQAFTLTMKPYASLDQSKTGTPISVGMFARSKGIYVPGPEPILIGLAVIGAALVAKLARRDD